MIDLLQLSEEQAEQLGLSMLGKVKTEQQVGTKYRCDQKTGQEKIVIPSEWLKTNLASTESSKRSHLKIFMKKGVEEKEIFVIELNSAKSLMKKKNCGNRELQTKTEEEKQRHETLTRVDPARNLLRRLKEESREEFFSKLEKVVTHEDFVYYVDNSLAIDKEDEYLLMSDSN